MAKGEPFHLPDKGAISSLHPRRGRSSISRFDDEPRFITNRKKPLYTSRAAGKEWQWAPWIMPRLDHRRRDTVFQLLSFCWLVACGSQRACASEVQSITQPFTLSCPCPGHKLPANRAVEQDDVVFERRSKIETASPCWGIVNISTKNSKQI